MVAAGFFWFRVIPLAMRFWGAQNDRDAAIVRGAARALGRRFPRTGAPGYGEHMSSNANADCASRHPMFRTMVMMGGSLAIGCGGITTKDGDVSPVVGGGGSGGSGGVTGSGGTITPGRGGSGGVITPVGGGSGGVITPVVGGTAGAITLGIGGSVIGGAEGSGNPAPIPCSPAQWDCSANPPQCAFDGKLWEWVLPESCTCDGSRPRTAADCSQGESSVCLAGTLAADGTRLDPVVPFECSCVPKQNYCEFSCEAAFSPSGYYSFPTCSEPPGGSGSILCGCAFVILY
jgi:hypothetical protein